PGPSDDANGCPRAGHVEPVRVRTGGGQAVHTTSVVVRQRQPIQQERPVPNHGTGRFVLGAGATSKGDRVGSCGGAPLQTPVVANAPVRYSALPGISLKAKSPVLR